MRTYDLPDVLTPPQLTTLRSEPGPNRVARAMEMTGITQTALAAAIGLTQAYVSDVVRQRHRTITVANAGKFARYFGCSIEDLFPDDAEGSREEAVPGSAGTADR